MNTPEHIEGPWELPKGSVFVFGSNTEGIHGTGSAKTALDHFGAKFGQAEGRQGDSYGIITTDLRSQGRYPIEHIDAGVNRFLEHAKNHPEETFWVTKIGSLRAGYTVDDIAGLWHGKTIPDNVVLPKEFESPH